MTTYTHALVSYSEQLLQQLLGGPPADFGVTVTTVDALIRQSLVSARRRFSIATDGQLLDVLKELFDQVELPGNSPFDQRMRRDLLRSLGFDYLVDEFSNVIDAWGIASREEYLGFARHGRRLPLRAGLREAVWALYEAWTAACRQRKLAGWHQQRRAALELRRAAPERPYRALIVDEAQDLTPAALRFLLASVSSADGIYLTADPAQSIYRNGFSWQQVDAELNMRGRAVTLSKNYRNTAQINEATGQLLSGDDTVSASEPAQHRGDRPLLHINHGGNTEIGAIVRFLEDAARRHRLPISAGAVLVHGINHGKQIASALRRRGLKAAYMESANLDLQTPQIKVLTLHAAKGLEFPFVAITRLRQGDLPYDTNAPDAEREAELAKARRLFYVGCTRAMRELFVSADAEQPSEFVLDLHPPEWRVMQE